MSNPITDSRGEPLDVQQLETSALNELSASHFAEAARIREDHIKENGGNKYAEWKTEAWELYVKHNEALDVLAEEIDRRERIDGFSNRKSAPTFGGGMLHSFSGEGGSLTPGGARGIAQGFVNSEEYQTEKKARRFDSPNNRIEIAYNFDGPHLLDALHSKALFYTATGSGGGFIVPQYIPGYQGTAKQTPDILALIPRATTTTDTIHWMRQDTWTQAATAVAEATATTGTTGTKPEGGLTFSRQTTSVETIAAWIPVTNQMLADNAQTQGIIENHLLLDLALELDNQILNGGGTGSDFTGILNAGIQVTPNITGFNNAMDAILRGITLVQTGDLRDPSAIVMHPNDFEALRVLRADSATSGPYLMGPPSEGGAVTLWGRPVAVTVRMTENTALVGDFQAGCMLWDREQSAIKTGYIDAMFTRNMQVVLAELRAAFTVLRPNAFCRVTGI